MRAFPDPGFLPPLPRLLIRLGLCSFPLNLGWEWGHLPAYLCPTRSVAEALALILPASAADLALTFVLVALGILVQREPACPLRPTRRRALAIVVAGAGLASAIELAALATGRWAYSDLMPLVPGLHVGWLPVLQMMLVPLLAATLACPGAFSLHLPGRS